MNTFTKYILPVLTSSLVAIVVVTLFEAINMGLYPFPEGFDAHDVAAVEAFTRTLPWTAFMLVLAGWACGAVLAGVVVAYMARKDKARARELAMVTGGVLGLFVLLHHFVVLSAVQPVWVWLAALVLAFVGVRFGEACITKPASKSKK